jgi:hypothetical protein
MNMEHAATIKRQIIPLLLGIFLIMASPVRGAQIEGVSFDDAAVVNGKTLPLRGVGLLRYMIFIKAYVGAFYLDKDISSDQVFSDAEKQLVLHYFHAISAEDFTEATSDIIEENVSPQQFAALRPRIDALNALYRDVKPGDRYTATYVPGVGTSLALNDTVLGTVPDAEFANAFFGIWIGESPIDKRFRDQLLGKRK